MEISIKVKDLNGNTFDLFFPTEQTIASIKAALAAQGVPTERADLYYCGLGLPDESVITGQFLKDNNVFILFSSAVYPEKSFPRVDNAFNFGTPRYADFFSDQSVQMKVEIEAMRAFAGNHRAQPVREQAREYGREDFLRDLVSQLDRGLGQVVLMEDAGELGRMAMEEALEAIEEEDEEESAGDDEEGHDPWMNGITMEEGRESPMHIVIADARFTHDGPIPHITPRELHRMIAEEGVLDREDVEVIEEEEEEVREIEGEEEPPEEANEEQRRGEALLQEYTEEQRAEFDRIMGYGYDRMTVLQVYEACDRDEETTVACLMSMG